MILSQDLSRTNWVVGVKETQKALAKKTLVKVYLAEDANKKILTPLLESAARYNIEIVWVKDSVQLGKSCGIAVKAAAAGLLL